MCPCHEPETYVSSIEDTANGGVVEKLTVNYSLSSLLLPNYFSYIECARNSQLQVPDEPKTLFSRLTQKSSITLVP